MMEIGSNLKKFDHLLDHTWVQNCLKSFEGSVGGYTSYFVKLAASEKNT
jgi:hypothetical protein